LIKNFMKKRRQASTNQLVFVWTLNRQLFVIALTSSTHEHSKFSISSGILNLGMVPESGCRRQTPVGFRGYLRHRNPNQQHGFGSETAHIECAALQPKVCNDVTQEQPTIQCEIKEFQYLIRPPKPPYFTTSTTRVRFNESPPDTYKICFDLLNRRSPPKSGTST